ncbi:hypothetical protein nACB2_113 [Acinetobacter phage nACB2]|nr:hypothetical protein nACB2_113 [Acinetobacter phage nACB2]
MTHLGLVDFDLDFDYVSGLIDEDIIQQILANELVAPHYKSIVGDSEALVACPSNSDIVEASDVPDMVLVQRDVRNNGFVLGDFYVGEVNGRRCLALNWDYTGLFIITTA